ncbi:MATE family efflux transporter [Heyndrickxia faecalis]|uniref:MATE family efflux transporter n=1 Tax=Heyndrickxia faecalis TaxID=2824910 RepID=UPI003D22E1E3
MLNFTAFPVKKGFILFSIPNILNLLSQQLYLIINTIVVGKYLGAQELAAVGNAGSMIGVFLVISGGLEMGCEIVIAKYMGEQKYQTIVSTIKGIILFAGLAGIVMGFLPVLLQQWLFRLIHLPASLWAFTGSYMAIYCFGLVFIFIFDILRAVLISMGDAKTPLFLVLFASCLNIGFTVLFICGFHSGVAGAAFAAVLSQIAGMAATVWAMLKRIKTFPLEKGKFVFPKAQLSELLSVSYPLMLQQGAVTLSALLLQIFVNPYGSEIISGYIAVNKILTFFMLIMIGFCQTLTIFTAANSGAKQFGRILEGYRFCIRFATVYVLFLTLADFVFDKQILSIFLDAKKYPDAAGFGTSYLKYSCIMILFSALKNVNESILRGYAKMKLFLLSNFSDLFFKTALTALFLPVLGLNSFWAASTISTCIAFLLSSCFIHDHQFIFRIKKQ